MASNPLSAAALTPLIASSLPQDADAQLKSATDALAIACHAGMLSVGFRLVGLSEDDRLDSTDSDTTRLPATWNTHPSHAFRYAHTQSSMQYLLKVHRLGNKTVISGIGMGDDKTASFDVVTQDFISTSALPLTLPGNTSVEDAAHAVQTVFISPSRLTDLGALLRVNIIQRLLPSLQKDGYEETKTSSSASTSTSTTSAPPAHNPHAPALPQPPRPDILDGPARNPPIPAGDFPPPGFDDEYDLLRGPRGPRPGQGQGMMPGYGERDLYPPGLGPRDPLRPGGVGPGLHGPPFGGGMHPTFDDPLFGGRGPGGERGDGSGQVPFGARYDPVGPGETHEGLRRGGPGRGGPGGPFGGFGGAGAPHNPFSGYGRDDFI